MADSGDDSPISGDDLYGDDPDSPYEFDDGDVEPAVAAAESAPAPAPSAAAMGTWQSDLSGAALDATSTESCSLFTTAPADAKTYLQRVARREKQASLRRDVLRLRAHFAPQIAKAAAGKPRLSSAQLDAAKKLMGIIGEDGSYCLACLAHNDWDEARAINWHLAGAGRTQAPFQQALRRFEGVSLWEAEASADATAPRRRVAVHELRGHGLCMAMASGAAEPGANVHIPHGSTRLQGIPGDLEGGTLICLSAIGREGRSTAASDRLAVSFQTHDCCNVFVCVHAALVLRAMAPSWLHACGLELQPHTVVRGTDGSSFLVFRGAALEPRQWELGNNSTGVPAGLEVPSDASMYFVVVTALDTDADFEGLRLATVPAVRTVNEVLKEARAVSRGADSPAAAGAAARAGTALPAAGAAAASLTAAAVASSAAAPMVAGGMYEAAASMARMPE